MAVLQFREVWSGRTGDVNDSNIRQYVRSFRVLTNSMLDGPETVIATVGLPKRWQPYTQPDGFFDLGSRCINATAKVDQDDPFTWLVDFKFSTIRLGRYARHRTELEKPRMADNQSDKTSPLDRPTIIRYATVKRQRVVSVDKAGIAVLNSAGQQITGLMADDSAVSITFTRNEPAPNFLMFVQYRDAINSDSFFGAGPRQVKVESITADEQFEGPDQNSPGLLYFTVSYTFLAIDITKWNPLGWQKHVLNQGYNEVDPNDNTRLRIPIDAHGRQVAGPVPLDVNGKMIPPNLAAANAIYLDFLVYNELPFAAFNLP